MRSWYVMLPAILLAAAAAGIGVFRITVPVWGARDATDLGSGTATVIVMAGVLLWDRHLKGRAKTRDRGSAENQAPPEPEEEPETTIKKPGWRAYAITYPGIIAASVLASWVLIDSGAALFGVDVPVDVLGTIAFFVALWSAIMAYGLHIEHENARKQEIRERREIRRRNALYSVSDLRDVYADAVSDLKRNPNVINYRAAQMWADRLDSAERRERLDNAWRRVQERRNGLVRLHDMTRAEWIAAGKPEGPIPEHEIPGRTISDSKSSPDSSGK